MLAASETTVASVMTFILAMLKYPEIQRKAQAEVDSIVGSDRLPDFSDRENMPYLTAVLKEVVRCVQLHQYKFAELNWWTSWNPIAPMGQSYI
jgi:cytochrome P450